MRERWHTVSEQSWSLPDDLLRVVRVKTRPEGSSQRIVRGYGARPAAVLLAGDLGLVDPHTLRERGGERGADDAGVRAQRADLERRGRLQAFAQIRVVRGDAAAQHDEIGPEQ